MRLPVGTRMQPLRWFAQRVQPNARVASEIEIAESETLDPVTAAVQQGLALGHGARQLTRADFERLRDLAEDDGDSDPAQKNELLLELVRNYPTDPRPQIHALRSMAPGLSGEAATMWQRLHERFPKSQPVAVQTLRRVIRFSGMEAGLEFVRDAFPHLPDDPNQLVLYILLHEELKDFNEVDVAVARLFELDAAAASHLYAAANLFHRRGDLAVAFDLARGARQRFPDHQPLIQLERRVDRDIAVLKASFPGVELSDSQASVAILRHILLRLGDARPAAEEPASRMLGRIVLISATLGIGGAERQFVSTALALQEAIAVGERVHDFDILGPVEIIVRSLRSRRDGDFFLQDLVDGGLRVEEYVRYAEFGGRPQRSCAGAVQPVLAYLPKDMAEATTKLADVLRMKAPEVVHIWQDGAIIACLLAALLAEIPRIVLSVRTLPSIDRLDRYRAEYETLYRCAVRMRGVRIVANSTAVARRYAEWLEVPLQMIGVVHNGVRLHPVTANSACAALAAKIGLSESGRTGFVVGTAMRFDRNKRPLLWIEAALAVLARAPETRFVLVGDGPLLDSAQELALRSGYGDRFLFTGRSDKMSFWIERISVFLLLSVYESLPNVLIEAQLAGVPVVSTPAGGAGETFIDGETGTLLPDSAMVDPEEVADAVLRWNLPEDLAEGVARQASQTAQRRFSIQSMLEATVASYTD
jgi:glycosyltransferase involved in cell wall biosynthesis